MFPSASPRGTLRVSGKQNSLFRLGPVIKCLFSRTPYTFPSFHAFTRKLVGQIGAVYTRENKPRLTLAVAYIIRERNYLYEYKLPGQDRPRLEKGVNVDFVAFIRGVRVLLTAHRWLSWLSTGLSRGRS